MPDWTGQHTAAALVLAGGGGEGPIRVGSRRMARGR
jgi:hypothetical protein